MPPNFAPKPAPMTLPTMAPPIIRTLMLTGGNASDVTRSPV